MRGKLALCPPFVGKGLPTFSDDKAWSASLSTFEAGVKTVNLSVELLIEKDEPRLMMQPLKLDLGHRLGRRFGADRFLEVIIPDIQSSGDHSKFIKRWLDQERHHFLGRRWLPFYIGKRRKKNAPKLDPTRSQNRASMNAPPKLIYTIPIYFFAIGGNQFRPPRFGGGIPPPEDAVTPNYRTTMNISGLLEWAISISNNAGQPFPKLFSRLALSELQLRPPSLEVLVC